MRKRKWSSDAERKRAARQALKADVPADDVQFNPDADAPDVRIDSKADAPVEQWRLDAREYLKTGKLPPRPTGKSPGFVAFKDCPEVPHDPQAAPWLGAGRGVVREYRGKAYVLVARHRGTADPDALEHGVVTAKDHAARLGQRCGHGVGWQCHAC